MGLFMNSATPANRPPVSALAVVSLIVAATGFINIVGFLVGPVLAIVALVRLRGTAVRGRRLAFSALWLSLGVMATAAVALAVILVVAYAQLPSPPHL
jgi:hypothetical protein